MKSSVQFRAKSPNLSVPLVEDGPGVNDNIPAILPGHEMSDLKGVPRQPAAETVAYYNRVTQIESYPAHPKQPVEAPALAPSMDARPERHAKHARAGKGLFGAVCLGSLLTHAAVFAALLLVASVATVPPPEEALDEAGDTISVIMLGDSDADQQAAGEETKDVDPQPQEVTAEAVQPQTVQPVETKPQEVPQEVAEAVPPTEVQPIETQPVHPTQPDVQEVSAETVVTPEPEVVTSSVPAETQVVQPQATEVAEAVQPTPTEVQPVEVQPTEQAVTPVEKPPVPKPPVEKRKDIVKKPPPKPVKVRSGSNGENEQDSRKGAMGGSETAESDADSQVAALRTGTGTSDHANYKGKLGASLYRCVQRLPRALRENGRTIRIALVVDGSGGVSSVRATSGNPELDSAAADLIRSCRVPPLPPELGLAKSFVQPVQIK